MNLPFRFFGWILQSTGDVCAISLCLKLHLRREYESKVFFLQVLSFENANPLHPFHMVTVCGVECLRHPLVMDSLSSLKWSEFIRSRAA